MIKLNGKLVQFSQFPNGETLLSGFQLQSAIDYSVNHVLFKYESDDDLVRLLFVKRYLDRLGCKAELHLCYMPYSRMDRVENDSAFTLKWTAELINSMGFTRVVVAEPHSDVTMALLERSVAIYPSKLLLDTVMDQIGFDKARDYLFSPDAGAQKRYANLTGFKQLVGFKQRDFATGKITGLQVVGDTEPGACRCSRLRIPILGSSG